MVKTTFEYTSGDFFELSSEQRLEIISKLKEKSFKMTEIAKEIEATSQEIHRNLLRLESNGFVQKEKDGYYALTTFGKTIYSQIPSIVFLSENREYFETHDFCGIPTKFVMRIGQLRISKRIKGVSRVLEQWKEIKENANEYVYETMSEIPLDLITPLATKLKENPKMHCHAIISESVISPRGRKKVIKENEFENLVKKGQLERRMFDVKTVVVLNEKSACVSFPDTNGDPDIREIFYSEDVQFHEWCLDYFRYCWYGSHAFNENKIKD